tara:strand:- start:904 stop:1074 length:171 start_codon:yes stop_codon:yes gene_type:complete
MGANCCGDATKEKESKGSGYVLKKDVPLASAIAVGHVVIAPPSRVDVTEKQHEGVA